MSRKLSASEEFKDTLKAYLIFNTVFFYLWGVVLTDPQNFWEGVYTLLHAGHLSGLILSSQLDSGRSNNGI